MTVYTYDEEVEEIRIRKKERKMKKESLNV
jgi:hypothetical protein